MEDRITIHVAGGVADVRLNRPDKMNALDGPMFDGIVDAIERLGGMDEVRCVVLSGGGRAFCAGLDMGAMAAGGSGLDLEERRWGVANKAQAVSWGWRALPMPVVAAVHGVAFGGGFQIMSGADIRIAHPQARFAIRESHWGLVPDMAGVALWRTLARDDVLRELTYTGREFGAEEARGYGFVTRLADDPLAEALALARGIAERNPHATRGAKRLLNHAADGDVRSILELETAEQLKVIRTPNQVEQVRANMEGRAAVFAD